LLVIVLEVSEGVIDHGTKPLVPPGDGLQLRDVDLIRELPECGNGAEPLGQARLGYRRGDGTFVPPRGHRAVFLGDLIDTKPGHDESGGVRATLHAAKAMSDRGDALVILGNHELNALCFHNLACLDHGAANCGPLVGYRWRGEARINPNHYLTDEPAC